MSRSRIVVAVVALLCLAAAADATTRFTCNNAGRTFRVTPGTVPIEIIVMSVNASNDCDIIVDDPSDGFIIALGVGVESRYETVTFGPLPGVPVRITALRAGGPNSRAFIRVSDSLSFIRGDLEDLGSAEELARRDPKYAKVLERARYYQRLKRQALQR